VRPRKGRAAFEKARHGDGTPGGGGVYLPLERLPEGCVDFGDPGWRCLILARGEGEHDPDEEPAGALTDIREAWLVENTEGAP